MSNTEPKFGFTTFAETWNGRLAMLGFAISVIVELTTGHSVLGQLF
ncbi:MAG: high light inducible protein [Synechococcaceae cyanobacterium SM2_3_1]|nr:high light inducible protein [Synechococcaceae cyanobacterium SM2_3_1]